jgi:hypothetical protein
VRSIPIHDDTVPIACTIGDEEIADRVELVKRMRTDLEGVERTEHGLLLRFPPGPELEADVRRFAVDEQRCCRFWGFAVEVSSRELTLRWDGPSAAGQILDGLYDYFEGNRPLSALAELL